MAHTRSPKYPFIDLERAITRAREFYDREQMNRVNASVAMRHWSYAAKSGNGRQTLAALVAFGLMSDQGQKANRSVALTDVARIVLLADENAANRQRSVQECALRPVIHRTIWERFDGTLPSDEALRHYLLFDNSPPFNENSVDQFVAQLRSTLTFAQLLGTGATSAPETAVDTEGSLAQSMVSVGDYVQWESGGVHQFRAPRRVAKIESKDNKEFAILDGETTGVPVDQLVVQGPQPEQSQHPSPESASPISEQEGIPTAAHLTANEIREDVFSLDEGIVRIQWPHPLSAESFDDLKAYVEIGIRKIGRSVIKDDESDGASM